MASTASAPTELMLALDFNAPEIADSWLKKFHGKPVIYKVGLELFLAAGPKWVAAKKTEGHRIFLDLKLHDIPNTVASAVGVACDLGVDFLTIHLSGGQEMLARSVEKVREKQSSLKLLGVSVLTSYSPESWADSLRSAGAKESVALSESIIAFSELAKSCGVPGMVSSALDLNEVNKIYPNVYSVTPGIRLAATNDASSAANDQKRVVTPRSARDLGANAIVMGRPIFQSENPLRTLEEVLESLK